MSENNIINEQNAEQQAPQATAETATTKAPVAKVETAHDDFDWSVDKRNVSSYSKEEKEKYDQTYEGTFKVFEENSLLTGTVVGLTNTDVVINIGFKSDGLISLNEFRDLPGLKIGDEVEVLVVEKEDRDGNLHLSRKQARQKRAWEKIVEVYRTGEVVTGIVTSKTKGGLIVDVYGMETFLPGSQIDVKPVTDYDQFVGKTMEFKVVKVNETIRNAVVSHKALIESDIEQQRVDIISKLEKGQVLEGTIKNITDFGAFIDLGGLDGLLYITDISWGRISHPSEVLQMDQKINVVVLDFDDEKRRISLGYKQLTPHPWDTLPATIVEGAKVKGKVVNIEDYGAFLEIMPGVEGLVHVSEISWASTPINAKEFFKLGEEYEAVVVTLSKEERKMSLSIKQLTEDPWATIETKFPVDSRHKGIVKNITPYGVFVELETGIGGMIHISDLSWIKRFNHPSEYTKVGNEIDVVILGIDKENRKLSLGHKQIEEDPWNTFETIFPINSVHEGTVVKKDDKGATVQLQYGLEAYAPARHLKTEDDKPINVEDVKEFMIIEFDRSEKRILVSHTRVWEKAQAEEKQAIIKEKKEEADKTRKAVKNIQGKVEKATLGDLGALAELREKLKQSEGGEEKSAQ
ncbi:small subunit ribosomal protein S1 [Chitinophaga terrae (ex Kim and Jung 2007)]|uniref:Small ribosomal subunit protein bS1 n=1 Tax=Chitinophaga terrae (ex Kim and Jung 2007) TaxID=408074 RepID=A0A1H4E7J4_9BACT|nr:30S ribosomal protein S1 [Chitinophaga terrae (ex Kim and Jung 2007)]MDQ0108334.1 small subunit ribosomal protein S1 [Chitinophaga terrae (ex Kim and Jung 2007)]GEP91364.1 30S ribosomal protein S1 [Chitinophaga terrae (ex Kim and Jung 2007)]SEA80530.1 small subunit ribosomal protein S1 [Chitinophaga terrae (ex Kim and Jung 2007)]